MDFGKKADVSDVSPKRKSKGSDEPVVERRGFFRAGIVCFVLFVVSMLVVFFSHYLFPLFHMSDVEVYYYSSLLVGLFKIGVVLFVASIVLFWASRSWAARIAVSVIGLVCGGGGLIGSIILLVLLCKSMEVSGMNSVSGLVWIFYFPALSFLLVVCIGILVVSILALRSSLKLKRSLCCEREPSME